jgi:hypothetical protein
MTCVCILAWCQQVVGVPESTTLREVTDCELDSDPLVVLPCGHAFLRSVADSFMGLSSFYSRAPDGRWVGT